MAKKFRCGGLRRLSAAGGGPVCEYEAPEPWFGACPGCGRFYDIIRDRPHDPEGRASLATLATLKPAQRVSTGVPEFDKVLGGDASTGYGIVPGASIVITGAPGAGKSTLLLQTANAVARGPRSSVLYTSGEQNREDVALLASRLGMMNPFVEVIGNEGDAYKITSEAEHHKPALLVLDSVQTAFCPDVGGDVGSAQQIKAVTNWITSYGKVEKVSTILVSHVNKDGDIAGPKTFEHLVDTIIFLDYYDEMPENFQQGERGQTAEEAIDNLNTMIDELEGVDFDQFAA